jgi:O-antigen biosynthesis protein
MYNTGMRIGYVVPMTWSCGGILAAFAHANELLDRGHAVTVFVPSSEPMSWFPLRAPIATFPTALHVDGAFDLVAFVGDTFRKLRFFNVKRRFLLLQGKDYLWVSPRQRSELLGAYADPQYHVIAVSRWLADFVSERCGNSRVSVVGNGVDTARFRPDDTPRKGLRVLIEGNFPDPTKNVMDALEIAARVRQHVDIDLWALGRRFVATGALINRLFEDPPPAEIPSIYAQCDLLIKTPVTEGFGLPHLEAMACGCVPVTYASGGVLDFCTHDENSLVAGVGNLPLMVWNVLRFLLDPALRLRLRNNAIATARQHSWAEVGRRLESIFLEELSRP